MSGPSSEGAQTRVGRPFAAHEQIEALLEHLAANSLLARRELEHTERWSRTQVFCLDTVLAKRFLVPAGDPVPPLSLWLSSPRTADGPGRASRGYTQYLYLIEDIGREDRIGVRTLSSYSALRLLAQEVGESERRPFGLSEREEPNSMNRRFSNDPAAFRNGIGAQEFPEREVSVFYRMRASCVDLKCAWREQYRGLWLYNCSMVWL